MSSPRRMLPSRGVYRALRDCLGSSRECNTRLSGALPCRELFQSYLAACQATLSPQARGVPFVTEGQRGAAHLQMCVVPLGSKLELGSSPRLLLQTQHERFPCVVCQGCLEKVLEILIVSSGCA